MKTDETIETKLDEYEQMGSWKVNKEIPEHIRLQFKEQTESYLRGELPDSVVRGEYYHFKNSVNVIRCSWFTDPKATIPYPDFPFNH